MLTIYKASAGSGKTYTLTYEYIKTLLGLKTEDGRYVLNMDGKTVGSRRSHRHRNILAITFTNAASEEMKSRIIKELNILASDASKSPYTTSLTATYGCTADQLRTAAKKALSEVLYDYGNFNVGTIDSFFQMILRTFSREVDHQGDYELCLNQKEIVSQALSLMLDELNYTSPGKHERLFRWIKAFTLERLRGGSSYNFFDRKGQNLRALAREVSDSMDETYGKYSDEIAAYLATPERIESFDAELSRRADSAFEQASRLARQILQTFGQAGVDESIFGKAVADRLHIAIDPPAKLSSTTLKMPKKLEEQASTAAEFLSAANQKKYAGVMDQLDAAAQLCSQFADAFVRAHTMRELWRELRRQLGTLDFLGLAQATLTAYLRDNNLILLGNTGELLKRIISDEEMPFIYERLGMRLTNLLIDEFQDTSRLQWHNLRPLVSNSLAEDNDNLIIGDEKQAIYRFRNSDSELLGHIVQNNDFPRQHTLRGSSDDDNTNHRSAHRIVLFNNTFFTHLAAHYGAQSYGNVSQRPSPRLEGAEGYVRVQFHDPETTNPEAIAEAMCADIIRQHNSGYRWRDILILVRKKDEGAMLVDHIIKHHKDIRILSSEALLLSSSSAVRSIMSMLNLIARSYAGEKLVRPDSAGTYATAGDIAMMMTRFNQYTSEGLDENTALRRALCNDSELGGELERQIADIRSDNPANLVALIEAIAAYKLTSRQREDEFAYIAALQDLALKHIEGPDPSIAAFATAYERNITQWAIQAAGDIDAVEIMTIHKSKGLERPCVHIPFADWTLHHGSISLWAPVREMPEFEGMDAPPAMRLNIDIKKSKLANERWSPFAPYVRQCLAEEETDNLNLAYVAFTRAARELIIHSYTKSIGADFKSILDSACALPGRPYTIDLSQYYDKEAAIFEYGKPTQTSGIGSSTADTVEAGEYTTVSRADIRELVCIADALGVDYNDIGGEEDKETVDKASYSDEAMQEAARRGSNMHAILAGMRTLDDLESSLRWHCSRFDIDADEAESYRREISSAIAADADTIASWFDPSARVYAERSIYLGDKDESFRPDRFTVTSDGRCIVVDYKFTTEARTSHRHQVARYVSLLRELGFNCTEGYIWYPSQKKIIKV